MSDRFNVVFSGELVGGADPTQVRANLAKLFKMDAGKVEALFSGKPVVIKKDADQATAMKFRAALRQAGAQCQMVPVDGAGPGPTAAEPAPAPDSKASFEARDPGPAPSASGPATFDAREPAGSPPAAAEPPPAREPDPESQSAAPSAASGDMETVGTIRTSGTGFSGDFDVAPAGADMGEKKPEAAPVDPDISHLSMAPAGSDMGQKKDEREEVRPDISHLSLADD